jgi:type VI secretion system VasD/TssJ family lipoprotein
MRSVAVALDMGAPPDLERRLRLSHGGVSLRVDFRARLGRRYGLFERLKRRPRNPKEADEMSGILRVGGRERADIAGGLRGGRPGWGALVRRALLSAVVCCTLACSKPPPPTATQVCFTLNASPTLNYYDGQSHVVVLYVYPLESALAFDAANVEDVLGGGALAGAVGKPREITVAPGQQVTFDEQFSLATTHVGLVADYYRAPGDPPGTRKASIAAKCAKENRPTVVLSARDLLVK